MKRLYPHVLVVSILAALSYSGLLGTFQHGLLDLRFLASPRAATGQVVLVAIDPPSLREIGVWPWSRRLHAEVVRELQRAGATDILFDVDFSARSSASDDAAFADALREAGGAVVLPIFKQVTATSNRPSHVHVTRPLPQFGEHAWSASVNISAEADGRVRRYAFSDEFDGELVPSAATLLASGAFNRSAPSFYVDYGIRLSSIPVVSFADVLNRRVSAAELRNKKVIIGSTAVELGDRYNAPNVGIISGPKLHVLAAESILQGRALSATSGLATIGGTAALVLMMLALWGRASLRARTIVLVALAVAIEATAFALQAQAAVVVDTAAWHAAIVAYLAVGWLNELDVLGMLARICQQRFQNIAMSLSDGVVCADGRSVVTFCNRRAAVIFGSTPDELIGQPLTDFCRLGSSGDDPEPIAKSAGIDQMLARGPVLELVGVRKGAETFPLEASISVWPDLEGVQYGVVLRDITVRRREEEQMRYLAMHDSLTGLANRASLRAALSAALDRSRAAADPVALMLIDLDNFKDINDTLGHQGGDEVLLQVAGRLRELGTSGELVGRFGGDEFAVLVRGADAAARAEALATTILSALKRTSIVVDGHPVFPGATIGIATSEGETADGLFVNADLALCKAKEVKRGSHVVYRADLRTAHEQRRTLEAELRQAVERGEFELFYQPQVRLRDNTLVGVEALIRWRHPTRGLLAPGQFLDVLNATTLSDEVGRWVLEQACLQGQRWHRMGHGLRVGVNLSPSQFRSDLVGVLRQVLAETGFRPEFLELEVTENILLDRDRMAEELLRQVQDMGASIAFDDFGTGYASLTHLKRFPLDRLKIDRSFVRDLEADSGSAAIVAAIGGLGKRLGLSIIAEGVEDARLLAPLLNMGCDEAQGYHFGKPMDAAGIEQRLAAVERVLVESVPTAA